MVLAVQAVLTMRIIAVFLALLLLAACVPEYREPENIVEKIKPEPEVEPVVVPERVIPVPRIKVFQNSSAGDVLWGYNEAGDLVLLKNNEKTIVFSYEGGNLVSIDDGIKPFKLYYNDQEQLTGAEKGLRRWIFAYTSKGKLVGMDDGERLAITYDSKGRLSSVKRDGGATTEFEYDEYNRTKAMYRYDTKTEMRYDAERRLALMSREDDHLVIGYWRYDLLSALSGTMYGLKETVNYGPTSVTFVSNVDQNEFTSQYPEDSAARMKSFNTFLFCKRFRKLPVLFDGQSWVLYHEYMKGSINEYLLEGFVCDYLP
jgi:YD repeat-containing protein